MSLTLAGCARSGADLPYRVVVWRAGRFLVVLLATAAALGLFIPGASAPLGCLDAALTDYANSGAGWTGGDSTWSSPLPDGRELFAFSDTFLGPISPPSRPPYAAFVHNPFVVRDAAGRWSTIIGGAVDHPGAVVAPADPSHWFWLGAATYLDGALQVPLTEWRATGPGPFDFAFVGSSLARFDPRDLRVPSVTPLPRSRGIQPFSYWTGRGWSTAESGSSRVTDGISGEFSVHRVRAGVYLLTTMQGGAAFSDRLIGRLAPSPMGPFGPAMTLYVTPESGRAGIYHDADVYTYNAHVHPEYSTTGTVVVSYNVNSIDTSPGGDVYRRVSLYRPRFVVVSLRWNDSAGSPPIGAARRPCP